MELLNRYLAAVGFWLPKAQRKDILAELSEAIRSQIDEKEAELGRALNEAEQEAILKAWGSPVLVAERYLPHRHLIGPVLYPIYRLVLKGTLLFYIIPWFAVWLCFFAIDSGYRLGSPGAALQGLWNTIAFGFTAITLAFALVERYHSNSKFLETFDVRKLPAVRDSNRISRGSAVTEVVTYGVTALWWVDILRLPEIPGISFRLSPVIAQTYHWPVLVLLLALTAMGVVNTIWPSWTRRRAGAGLAIHAYGVALVGLLLFAGPFLQVVGAAAGNPALLEVTKWTGLAGSLVLVFCGIDYTLRGIQDFRRMRGMDPIHHWVMRLFAGDGLRAV